MITLTKVWKYTKWALLTLGLLLLPILGFLLRGVFVREHEDGMKADVLPDVEAHVRVRVERAEEEALVARVEARVKAEHDKQQLVEIAKENDGAERRRQLAALLRRL